MKDGKKEAPGDGRARTLTLSGPPQKADFLAKGTSFVLSCLDDGLKLSFAAQGIIMNLRSWALVSLRSLHLKQPDGSSISASHLHPEGEAEPQGEAELALLPWAMAASEVSLTGTARQEESWEGSLDRDA